MTYRTINVYHNLTTITIGYPNFAKKKKTAEILTTDFMRSRNYVSIVTDGPQCIDSSHGGLRVILLKELRRRYIVQK